MTSLVRRDTGAGVATITLDSPENRNALSSALMNQLLHALAEATNDDSVRAIVLTHTGSVFCSGVDLKETAAAIASGGLPAARLGDVLAALVECPKPVVARVGGAARAGGIGLVGAADIAFCTENATFAFSEVRIGVIPAVISATVLPRITSRAAARLYLTGEVFDGRTAAEIGLVTQCVPTAEDLTSAVAECCAALTRGAPAALAGAKALLRRPAAESLRAELAELTQQSVTFFTSAEGREGITAFREKRDPFWILSSTTE